mmetsp:Transcript_4499/g.8349  ORF Transcript_4499/g.8349 Transcript_4499/m.8349 type:complete len:201 (+) Transcript_4499:303-905(+)
MSSMVRRRMRGRCRGRRCWREGGGGRRRSPVWMMGVLFRTIIVCLHRREPGQGGRWPLGRGPWGRTMGRVQSQGEGGEKFRNGSLFRTLMGLHSNINLTGTGWVFLERGDQRCTWVNRTPLQRKRTGCVPKLPYSKMRTDHRRRTASFISIRIGTWVINTCRPMPSAPGTNWARMTMGHPPTNRSQNSWTGRYSRAIPTN